MTAKELAKLINGVGYGQVLTDEQIQTASENKLVVVFGYSDDTIVFEGAISEELPEGNSLIVPPGKEIEIFDDEEGLGWSETGPTAVYLVEDAAERPNMINGQFSNSGVWEFKTDIPCERFEVMYDDELFCIGLVFSLDDLKEEWTEEQIQQRLDAQSNVV